MVSLNLARLVKAFFHTQLFWKQFTNHIYFWGVSRIFCRICFCANRERGLRFPEKTRVAVYLFPYLPQMPRYEVLMTRKLLNFFHYGVCFVLFISCVHNYSYLPAIFYLRLLSSKLTRCTYLQFNHDIHFEFGKISNPQMARLLWALTDSNIENKFN